VIQEAVLCVWRGKVGGFCTGSEDLHLRYMCRTRSLGHALEILNALLVSKVLPHAKLVCSAHWVQSHFGELFVIGRRCLSAIQTHTFRP
jgi:hypothetical protein